MTNFIHSACQAILSRPIAVALVSYVLALAYLLIDACPLLFAVFLAVPLSWVIGLPVLAVAGLIVLGSDVKTALKDSQQFIKLTR